MIGTCSVIPLRRGLRPQPDLRGWRVLAFGEAVDAVVEQQDLQVEIAADDVEQVVAADRQAVAIAGHNPHRKLGVRDLDTGRECGGAAVDRVEAIGVHVVGEAARAADAGHEHDVLALVYELGHDALDVRKN